MASDIDINKARLGDVTLDLDENINVAITAL